MGQERTPRLACPCQQAEKDAWERLRKEEENDRYRSYLRSSGLGWTLLNYYRFENLQGMDPSAVKTLQKYADHFPGWGHVGLLIWGPPGAGKTFAAGCIVNQAIDGFQPAVMVSFRQLLSELSALPMADRKKQLDSLFAKRLLCLDDFDLRFISNHHMPLIIDIADRISRYDYPVIITTRYTLTEMNQPRSELEQKVFPGLISRSVPVLIDGEDLRKKEQESMMQMLRGA